MSSSTKSPITLSPKATLKKSKGQKGPVQHARAKTLKLGEDGMPMCVAGNANINSFISVQKMH